MPFWPLEWRIRLCQSEPLYFIEDYFSLPPSVRVAVVRKATIHGDQVFVFAVTITSTSRAGAARSPSGRSSDASFLRGLGKQDLPLVAGCFPCVPLYGTCVLLSVTWITGQ